MTRFQIKWQNRKRLQADFELSTNSAFSNIFLQKSAYLIDFTAMSSELQNKIWKWKNFKVFCRLHRIKVFEFSAISQFRENLLPLIFSCLVAVYLFFSFNIFFHGNQLRLFLFSKNYFAGFFVVFGFERILW